MGGHGNSETGLKEVNFQRGGGADGIFFPVGLKCDQMNTIVLS